MLSSFEWFSKQLHWINAGLDLVQLVVIKGKPRYLKGIFQLLRSRQTDGCNSSENSLIINLCYTNFSSFFYYWDKINSICWELEILFLKRKRLLLQLHSTINFSKCISFYCFKNYIPLSMGFKSMKFQDEKGAIWHLPLVKRQFIAQA